MGGEQAAAEGAVGAEPEHWEVEEMSDGGGSAGAAGSHTAVMHPLQPGLMLIYGGTGAPFGITTSNTIVTCNLDTQYFRSDQRR